MLFRSVRCRRRAGLGAASGQAFVEDTEHGEDCVRDEETRHSQGTSRERSDSDDYEMRGENKREEMSSVHKRPDVRRVNLCEYLLSREYSHRSTPVVSIRQYLSVD